MNNRSGQILLSLAFSTSAILSQPISSARGEYQTALELYGKKQYSAAAQYFETASLSDRSNVQANYYAGYSFYLAGRKTEAIASFWRLAKAYPSLKEGIQARAILKNLDPLYAQHDAGTAADATSSDRVQTRSAAGAPATNARQPSKPSARSLVDQLVQVRRSNSKLPNVTPDFVEAIKGLLVAMPVPVLSLWKDKGGSVVIAPSVVEIDFRIQNTVPRGWDQDASWKDSPALTQGTQVVVSQYRLNPRTGEPVDNTPEIGVVRHEAGHAIDYCMGEFTDSTEFKHAYYLDSSKVPEENRKTLDYFLQKATGGPSETFAELFCYRMGGETDSGRKETCDLVHKNFPLCEKELEKRLAAL